MATGTENLGIEGTVGEGILDGKKLAASSVVVALVLVAITAGGIFLYEDWDGDNLGTYEEFFETSTSPFDKDSDRDGVGDGEEIRLGTDPKDSDTDNDSLADNVEIRGWNISYKVSENSLKELGELVTSDPTKADTDGDNLEDGVEKELGTHPREKDTDKDGLSDFEERSRHETNPKSADTDEDGLSDFSELKEYGTDPLSPSTDNDNLSDGEEILDYGTNPKKNDTDGDGLWDGLEVNRHNTNPLDRNTDGDRWTDDKEVTRGTDPMKVDIPTADAGRSYETEEVHNQAGENNTIELNGENSGDPDGFIEEYSWEIVSDPSKGSGLSDENSSTPIFHPPPHVDSIISVKVELTVTDNSGVTVKDTAVIDVKSFNEPPKIISTEPSNFVQKIDEDSNQTFSITVWDEENSDLSYTWSGGLSGSGSEISYQIPWDPDHENENFEVNVTVKDNLDKSDSSTWLLTVTDVNQPPKIHLGGPYSVDEDHGDTEYKERITEVSVVDPEGDNRSYEWEIVDGPGSLTEVNSLTPVYHSPAEVSSETDAEIKITVNDGYSENYATTTIKVKPYTEPAEFELSNLSVSPSKASPGEPVDVSVDLSNSEEATGEYTVKLRVNGNVEKSRTLTLEGGKSTTVSFTLKKDVEKTYSVQIGNLSDSFEVTSTIITRSFEWTDHLNEKWTWKLRINRERYEDYQEQTHVVYQESGYLEFVTYNDELIKSVADNLVEDYSDSENQANYILSFVQSFSYVPEGKEYVRYPVETIVDNGDCEDTVILYTAIMKAAGHDAALIVFENHMIAGVNLSQKPQYGFQSDVHRFEKNGKWYYACETTGEGWRVGDLPETLQGESPRVYVVD